MRAQRMKILNFIMQLVFTPISLIINALVLFMILGITVNDLYGMDLGSFIFASILCFALGFALNVLFYWLKGKVTSYAIEVNYDCYSKTTLFDGYTTRVLEEKTWEETGLKWYLTFWGWLSRMLCFIAFPLRLIALIMSYVALFVPCIYSTPWKLKYDSGDYLPGAKVTHILFDFVIVRVGGSKSRTKSAKGIIWAITYIVAMLLSNFSLLIVANFIGGGSEKTFAVLLIMFFLLSSIIITLKHSILISFNYSKQRALINLAKILVFPILNIIIYIISHI